MATFAELQTKVADWLDRSDLSTQVKDFINIAIREIERSPMCNFKYMKNVATGSLVAGTHTLALPTRYKETQALFVLTSTSEYHRLEKTSVQRALSEYPYLSDLRDFPTMFCTDDANDQFLLRATPDQAYSYVHYYYATSAELSADGDTNWWTLNAWEVVLFGALLKAEPFMKNDERVKLWAGMYKDALKGVKDTQIDEDWGGGPPHASSGIVV
ncbi:MAG: phage adaptor protein [Planctomycetota bacterium]|jgi:hypothetical protein